MTRGMFWTERRCAGIVLILGGVLFLASALGIMSQLTDGKGTFAIYLPPQGLLGVVFQHQTLWWWANALFLGGSIVTMLGLALLTRLLREAGDRTFAPLGLILFFFGTVFWSLQLAFRLSVSTWAAQESASTGIVPNFYVPLAAWTQAMFVIYTVSAFAGLVLYGLALRSSRVVQPWMGWLAIGYGLAGLGVLAFTGDFPPFLHYLLLTLMGILLLMPSPRSTSTLPAEEMSAASTATVR